MEKCDSSAWTAPLLLPRSSSSFLLLLFSSLNLPLSSFPHHFTSCFTPSSPAFSPPHLFQLLLRSAALSLSLSRHSPFSLPLLLHIPIPSSSSSSSSSSSLFVSLHHVLLAALNGGARGAQALSTRKKTLPRGAGSTRLVT